MHSHSDRGHLDTSRQPNISHGKTPFNSGCWFNTRLLLSLVIW